MRSRTIILPSLLLCGTLIAACSSNRFFSGPEEFISFEIHDRFESSVPGFDGTLNKPIDCDIDENGLIYVLDEGDERIVVFSPELEVIRLIGDPQKSPPEELLSFSSNRSRIAVGAGIVAFSNMEGSIKVFTTEGIYLGTFETEDQVHDLAISPDGHIVTLTLDNTHPIISYDRDGHVRHRFGPAFIEVESGERRGLDHFSMTVLSDGSVALLSRSWLRFRWFDQHGAFRDYQVDPLTFYHPTDESWQIEIMEERAAKIKEWPPERVNEAIRAGEYHHMEIGSVTGSYIGLGVTSVDNRVWLDGAQRLAECDSRGRVLRLIDTCLIGKRVLGQDGLIVQINPFHLTLASSLAVGRIPDR